VVALNGYQPGKLRAAMIENRPQYVLVDMPILSATAARRTIADVAWQFALPVAVMGHYPTCQPSRAISIPGVSALFLGEYERPAVDFLQDVRSQFDSSGLQGVWLNTAEGLVKGAPRPVETNLDSLPFPDRDVFDYGKIVAATGEAAFKAARGCARWCGQCINDIYVDLHQETNNVRRRSVGNLLAEISDVIARYEGVKRIRFYDHAFACDLAWLREFAARYRSSVSLPYSCYVPLEDVCAETAELLASSGCNRVDTMIGSGSRFIRDEVQTIHVSNEQIIGGCALLRQCGIDIFADVYVGLPYETQITFEDTINLVAKTQVRNIRPVIYYPLTGTRAADMCRENGWVSGRGEECYWRGRSVLDMPSLPARSINDLAQKLPSMLKRRRGLRIRQWLSSVFSAPKNG